MSDGIRVIRVYSFISHSKSRIFRALAYLSFMVTALVAATIVRRPDVVYAYHPQITVGMIGVFLKKIKGVPYVTDVQDLWPDALSSTGIQGDGIIFRIVGRLCSLVYAQAAHVVVLSQGYRSSLIQRAVPGEKISVVYNWYAVADSLEEVDKKNPLISNYRYKLVYAGNLGAAQDLRPVIEAVASLESEGVSITLIGAGIQRDKLIQYVESISAKNIFFCDYVAPAEIGKYLSKADVLLVHLRDDPLFRITIPSKIQSYLYAGKPIVVAVGGEARDIVLDAGAGVAALPGNVESIASATREIIGCVERWKVIGSNGRKYYDKFMGRDIGINKIFGILKQITT